MSEIEILIADSQTDRGERVASALEAAGHGCAFVENGPVALEKALAEKPSVVVAETDLTLLDAGTLAEILRANPKTRQVRFLFLGGEPEGGLIGGIGDAALEGDCGTDDVLEAVASLLERQERVALLDGRATTQLDFSGVLSELSPPEILQILHLRGAEGRLVLEPVEDLGDEGTGEVVLRDGEIDSASIANFSGEKALFRMLAWQDGCFSFEPGAVDSEPTMKTPTRSLLAEGLRQIEEWSRVSSALPALESSVRLSEADSGSEQSKSSLHPLTQEVLQLLEEYDRVSDIVDHCSYPDYQVLQTLHTLEERGVIGFGHARIAPTSSLDLATPFNEAQARRLRSWSRLGLPREAPVPDAKLLVMAADAESVQRFIGVLAKVPGVEVSPRFERGEIGAEDLETLARIDVGGSFGIDLVHLPTADRLAPLWPLAAHRGLGTLVLMDTEMRENETRLAKATETLIKRPGARTFNVVMLAEGERLSPEELRKNLSLIDDASLFLLPIDDSSKDPGSLLRTLFARVVP